jgi:hypothetical protein
MNSDAFPAFVDAPFEACANNAACFHCGEAIPADVRIRACVSGHERAVCCHGCAAAAQWIGDRRSTWERGLDQLGVLLAEPDESH